MSRARLVPTDRRRAGIAALLLVGSVVAVAVAGGSGDSPGNPPTPPPVSSWSGCPLTLPQEYKAGQVFEKMMPVLMHPRCFNCHGGVDETLPANKGGHLGGPVGPKDDCLDCHVGVRNLNNPRRRFLAWRTPSSDFFFKGRTPRDLCNQFKFIEGSPERFVGHMINDNGGDQFGEAAYQGDRSLNTLGEIESKQATGRDMVPQPPPIPHGQLVSHAREWANTVGTAGWKVPDCGCRLMGDAWEGTVTTVFTYRDPPGTDGFGTLTETMNATVRFEIDSSFMTIPPGDSISSDPWLVWKTTSGVLKWTVDATGGNCTTSASGTVPIRFGADRNPWGLIWIQPDSSGDLTYSAQIGPWPEGHEPQFTYRCRREIPSLAGISYAVGQAWWNHPDGVKVSDEGKARFALIRREDRVPSAPRGTIKDSLINTHPMGGTIKWLWDFKLVR